MPLTKTRFGILVLSLAAAGVVATWTLGHSGDDSHSTIEITEIPLENAGQIGSTPITGTVHTRTYAGLKVVIYALGADRWWVQPYSVSPMTDIDEHGHWSNESHGGEQFAALLVKAGFNPEAKLERLPGVGGDVLAVTIRKQTQYTPLPGETKKQISITHVPDAPEGSIASTPLTGTVEFADNQKDQVVVYALIEGKWRLQPYAWSERGNFTADGKWSVVVHGALDFAALLVDQSYTAAPILDSIPALGNGVLSEAFDRPLPIQDRPWFNALLVGTVAVLGLLSLALILAFRRLRRHAVELEDQVRARTSELRDYASNLEKEVQARTAEMREDVARRVLSEKIQRTIARISEAAVTIQAVAEFYPIVHREIAELMPVRNFYIALIDRAKDELVFAYYQDERDPHPAPRKIQQGLTEYALRLKEPVLLSRADIDALEARGEVLSRGTLAQSWLAVPLRSRDVVLGVMTLQSYSKDIHYSERDQEILQVISYPVANAIERKQAEDHKSKLEEQLTQAQKMESIGRLAGGVAHDFNNMLQAILGNASLALLEIDPSSPVREYLEEIRKASVRSVTLTSQLLAFARKQTISPKVIDLGSAISAVQGMLQRLIGEQIELVLVPHQDLWPVEIDPGQIDQVLMNLTVNARDSISGVGRISIEATNVALDRKFAAAHPPIVEGEYVLLNVSDNGHGMDDEVMQHLFEPFFTTKPSGEGTGLGLATVYGIVRQNNGYIEVRSKPGEGTVFQIYLPRAKAPSRGGVDEPPAAPAFGTETILIVEDEPQVLNLGSSILKRHGYNVLSAGSPKEALGIVEEFPDRIHLLVTDVIMPEMNGHELQKRIRKIRPGIGCLYMSGFPTGLISDNGVIESNIHLIQKPFTLESLTAAVRAAIDHPRQGTVRSGTNPVI